MKKKDNEFDDLRPEYDFAAMQIVARGSGRKKKGEVAVILAPDVAKKFPTSKAVNNALRLIIEVADQTGEPEPVK
jgi:hypothetical protein